MAAEELTPKEYNLLQRSMLLGIAVGILTNLFVALLLKIVNLGANPLETVIDFAIILIVLVIVLVFGFKKKK